MSDTVIGWLRRLLRQLATRLPPAHAGHTPLAERDATVGMARLAIDGMLSQAQILEYVNDAAITVDPTLRIVSWNCAAETIYGWPAAEVLGKALDDIIPVVRFPDGGSVDEVIAAYKHDGYWNGEVIQRHRDGRELVIDGTSRVIRDAQGDIGAILAINRDITEAKRVEQTLRESEERFRQLFERSPDGIFLIDPLHPSGTWPIVDCNEAAARMNGYTREEILGQTIHMFSPNPHAPDEGEANYEKLRRAGVLQAEDIHRRKDGTLMDIEYSTSLITLGGRPFVLGVDRDISARKRAEQVVRESEEHLRRLAEASFEGIIIHDQGTILDVNESFAAMLGSERAALIGKQAVEFAAPEARAGLVSRIRSSNDQSYESVGVRNDGSTFPVEIRSRPMPYQGRTVRVAAIRDLTERQHAEQERMAIERKLLETQKLESLGVLAGGIAHDFNNLLAIILGNASLALLQLPPDAEVRRTIEAIKTAAHHGADLPRQMLAYAGKGPAAMQPVDLNLLVAEIADLLQASVGKNVTLRYQLTPHLPLVDGDPGQLRQVALNLIINAAEAIGEHEGHVTLAIETVHATRATFADAYFGETLTPGAYVRLQVSDTGSGMDAATQARIFEPFFTTKFVGRGLGLPVLLGIVRSHRGALKLQSTPGQGTTFTILLPAGAAPAPPPGMEAAPQLAGAYGTVLVIDDDEGVRSIAAELLQRFGFTTLVAADGQTGVVTFNRHADDIAAVLLDLTLPGLSSAEVCAALRGRTPQVPIVLMSGYPEQQVAERFAGEAPTDFLPKPFTAAQLQERVLAAVERGSRPGGRTRD